MLVKLRREELKKTGIKTKDALHIASAIAANCDYFISTDIRLLKSNDTRIKVINPVDFVMRKGVHLNE